MAKALFHKVLDELGVDLAKLAVPFMQVKLMEINDAVAGDGKKDPLTKEYHFNKEWIKVRVCVYLCVCIFSLFCLFFWVLKNK